MKRIDGIQNSMNTDISRTKNGERVFKPITENLAKYLDKYAKDRIDLPYK